MNLLNYLQKEEDIEVIGRARDGKEACEIIKNKEPDVVVIRPESTYIYFPIPMQEEIEGILATDYKRVEDVDSKSNYGMYNIYIKNK